MREEVKEGAGDRETKEVVRIATDGLMFLADEKQTLKKKRKDHTDEGRR